MLTKQDLTQIKQLLDPIKEKIDDLEAKLDDTKSDLSMDLFKVRAELAEEAKHIKRRLTEIKKDQEVIIKFADDRYREVRDRVENLEQILKVSTN